jgi:hypothetical protein
MSAAGLMSAGGNSGAGACKALIRKDLQSDRIGGWSKA